MDSGSASWSLGLRVARKAVALTREELADISGVSTETVKAYERGSRAPSRPSLVAILDALKLDRLERDSILVGAGLAPDGYYHGPGMQPGYFYTVEEAGKHAGEMPWPCFVVGDLLNVVAANPVAQRLWGIDLERDYPDPFERNMLALAGEPRFAGHVLNWDEMAGVAVAIFKGHHLGGEDLDAPSPSFNSIVQRFLQGDPRYVKRFLDLWQSTPPATPKSRWAYPVVWRDDSGATLRFKALVTTANEPEGMAFNDWHPLDSATWEALARLMACR